MAQTHTRKSIFDAIREWLGRKLRPDDVTSIDNVLDAMSEEQSATCEDFRDNTVPSVPSRRISSAGITLIKRFEGCASLRQDGKVEAYPDPGTGGHPWTIGWGATGPDFDGSGEIGPGTVWTQEQCDLRLQHDLLCYSDEVSQAIGRSPTTQSQFDAMVSFHYNTGAIARATLTKRHCAGDFKRAATEFQRWNRAGGRVLRGLTRRRAAEAALYLKELTS